ncbi:MAG: radical SAM protein [Oligoflexia bacterium]|nr:radical SAM protein [Oligoflexia bacterium]
MTKENNFKKYLSTRISSSENYDDLLSFPRYLEIETINYCNAKCRMCVLSEKNNDLPKKHQMSDQVFDKILDEVATFSSEIKRVSLYRNGEPLLDNDLAKKIKKIKKCGISEVAISTNVSLLNEEKSIELLESGIDIIMLSIDSLSKEILEFIRPGISFDIVLKNAHKYIQLRNKLSPKSKIFIRMIKQSANKHEWDGYQQYWRQYLHTHDRVYYNEVYNWGGQLSSYDTVAPYSINASSNKNKLPCVSLWSLLVILADGTIPLCNIDYKISKKIGNINNNSIKEVWNSEELNSLRFFHLNNSKNILPLCSGCNAWSIPSDLRSKQRANENLL